MEHGTLGETIMIYVVRALSIFLHGIHKSDLHIYTHFQAKISFFNTSALRCTRDAIHIVTQEQFEKQKLPIIYFVKRMKNPRLFVLNR